VSHISAGMISLCGIIILLRRMEIARSTFCFLSRRLCSKGCKMTRSFVTRYISPLFVNMHLYMGNSELFIHLMYMWDVVASLLIPTYAVLYTWKGSGMTKRTSL
jgi:hypothetical protein